MASNGSLFDSLKTEQDFLATTLINYKDQNHPIYFLLGTLQLHLKTLFNQSAQWPTEIAELLKQQYSNGLTGLTLYEILKQYCGLTDPYTKQCHRLLQQVTGKKDLDLEIKDPDFTSNMSL